MSYHGEGINIPFRPCLYYFRKTEGSRGWSLHLVHGWWRERGKGEMWIVNCSISDFQTGKWWQNTTRYFIRFIIFLPLRTTGWLAILLHHQWPLSITEKTEHYTHTSTRKHRSTHERHKSGTEYRYLIFGVLCSHTPLTTTLFVYLYLRGGGGWWRKRAPNLLSQRPHERPLIFSVL